MVRRKRYSKAVFRVVVLIEAWEKFGNRNADDRRLVLSPAQRLAVLACGTADVTSLGNAVTQFRAARNTELRKDTITIYKAYVKHKVLWT